MDRVRRRLHRVQLDASSELLAPTTFCAGIEIDENDLIAWCAPRSGPVEILLLSWHPDPDRVELTQWLTDRGFEPTAAAHAAQDLLKKIHNWPD